MSDHDTILVEGQPPLQKPTHYPIHPLFPVPAGQHETVEICWITFDRVHNETGKRERCPKRYDPAQLTSFQQVIEEWGGGSYQFIGIDAENRFSRWGDKDVWYVDAPSKPFYQEKRAASSTTPTASSPQQETAPKSEAEELRAMWLRESIERERRSQERFENLLTALVSKQGQSGHDAEREQRAQERFENLITAIVSKPVQPTMDSTVMQTLLTAMINKPAQPAIDPMAMFTAMTSVLEKVRTARSSVAEFGQMVEIMKKMPGKSSDDEDAMLSTLLSTVTSAMGPGGQVNQQQQSAPQASASSPPSDLIWVSLPGVGAVMMTREQASTAFSQAPTQAQPQVEQKAATPQNPPPAAQEAEDESAESFWDELLARLDKPKERAAFKKALETRRARAARRPPASDNERAKTRKPVQNNKAPSAESTQQTSEVTSAPTVETKPPAPAAPLAPPASESSTPSSSAAPAASETSLQGPPCSVCRSTSFVVDPANDTLLICANGHRRERKMRLEMTLQDIEEILNDPEARAQLAPEVIARLEALKAQGEGAVFEC